MHQLNRICHRKEIAKQNKWIKTEKVDKVKSKEGVHCGKGHIQYDCNEFKETEAQYRRLSEDNERTVINPNAMGAFLETRKDWHRDILRESASSREKHCPSFPDKHILEG